MSETIFASRISRRNNKGVYAGYESEANVLNPLPRRFRTFSNEINRRNSVDYNQRKKVHRIKFKTLKESRRKPSSNMSVGSMISIFLKRSSVYALSQVGNSATPLRKAFWICILIIGIIGSVAEIGQFLSSYLTYPIVVSTDLIREDFLEFPAVTICNMNSVRQEYLSCIKQKLNYQECVFGQKSEFYASSNSNEPVCDEALLILSRNTTEGELWKSLYIAQNYRSRVAYGHQPEDFIVSCRFGDKTCSEQDFKLSASFNYGNCYTFNAVKDTNYLLVKELGPVGGLELELDVEASKYTEYTQGAGVKIQIHNPHQEHNIEYEGFNLSPGFLTYIGLSKHGSIRLPSPYKDHCRQYEKNDSQKFCYDRCANAIVYDLCSCNLDKHIKEGKQRCDLTEPSVLCCLLKLRNVGRDVCNCPLPCEEIVYPFQISSIVWPSRAYFRANSFDFLHTGDGKGKILSYDDVRETRLKVTVFFSTLDYTVHKQSPMYQSSEVLSQIGSQVGLWLGLSLVAVFECIENIIGLCRNRLRRSRVLEQAGRSERAAETVYN